MDWRAVYAPATGHTESPSVARTTGDGQISITLIMVLQQKRIFTLNTNLWHGILWLWAACSWVIRRGMTGRIARCDTGWHFFSLVHFMPILSYSFTHTCFSFSFFVTKKKRKKLHSRSCDETPELHHPSVRVAPVRHEFPLASGRPTLHGWSGPFLQSGQL